MVPKIASSFCKIFPLVALHYSTSLRAFVTCCIYGVHRMRPLPLTHDVPLFLPRTHTIYTINTSNPSPIFSH